MSPLHSDRFLFNPVAMASLVTLIHAQIHSRETILAKSHYLLYHAVSAMSPASKLLSAQQ